MTRHDVTDLAAGLDVDAAVELPIEGVRVALCRAEDGLFAFSNTCTHAEARLTDGFVFDNSIECPLHQARYELATGALLEGPECPALQTYPVVEENGRLFVELP